MTRASTPLRCLGAFTLAGVALGVLGSCATDDEEPGAGASPSASATATESSTPVDPSSYLPVPDGVELTPAGTAEDLGESAVVAWEPRQEEVAVVELSVERIERTTFEQSFQGWQVDKRTAEQTPYFVTLEAENVSADDLGGLPLPLYATDGSDLLVEPTGFQGDFEPCPGGALPEQFAPGDRTELCLVFLTDPVNDLAGVAFLPAAGVEPITWSGEIAALDPPEDEKSTPPPAPTPS